MGRHEKKPSKKKVKIEWSKLVCLLTILAGLLIVQECLFLMYLCIKGGYTATAAWLTAATGVGEAVIIAGANGPPKQKTSPRTRIKTALRSN